MAEREARQLIGEVGAPGTKFFHGFIDGPEFNPKLEGKTGVENIRKMRVDPQVQAAELIVTLPIRTATYSVSANDPQIQADLEEALFRRLDWDRFLRHAMLAFPFGYELMEKVVVEDQGKFWFGRLAHRDQETIERWTPNPDDQERIGSISQQVWKDGATRMLEIPGEKLFHLAWEQVGNNFAGRSGLRAAYKPWFVKETAERIGAIGIERYGLGVPKWSLPKQYSAGDLAAAVASAQSFRAGEKAYIIQPDGFEFAVVGSGEADHYQPLPWVRYSDEMIATSVLAMVLSLGKTETGSRALGETMLDLFMISLGAVADWLVAAVNDQLVRPWLRWNYPNGDDIEAGVEWSNLQLKNIQMTSEALDRLGRGLFITPDDATEDVLRTWLSLPEREKQAPASAREPERPGRRVLRDTCSGHIHAAAADNGRWWRPVRPEEQFLALREIDGRIDDGRDQVASSFRSRRKEWADDLVRQLRDAMADGDYSDVADVAIPTSFIKPARTEIVTNLREVYRYGRRAVQDERRRQKRGSRVSAQDDGARDAEERSAARLLRDEPLDSEEVSTLFTTRATRYLKSLAARMEAIAIERAMGILRSKGDLVTDSDYAEIADSLVDALDASAVNDATVLVSEALGLGRDAAAQAAADEIGSAYYSTILDRNICDVCIQSDGEEVALASERYYELMPPNKGCESIASGSNRCRCLLVYIFEEK
uniref:Portal protein n=1 Tax=viral metagenome TaxID=1070528 RepID=A0A6M3J156_9ZZZZ